MKSDTPPRIPRSNGIKSKCTYLGQVSSCCQFIACWNVAEGKETVAPYFLLYFLNAANLSIPFCPLWK